MIDLGKIKQLNRDVIIVSYKVLLTESHDAIANILQKVERGAHIVFSPHIHQINIKNTQLSELMSDIFISSKFDIHDIYDEIRAKTVNCISYYTFGYTSEELKILGTSRPIKLSLDYHNGNLTNVNKNNNKNKNFWEVNFMKLFKNRAQIVTEGIAKIKDDLLYKRTDKDTAMREYESLRNRYPDFSDIQDAMDVLQEQIDREKVETSRAQLKAAQFELNDLINQNQAKVNKFAKEAAKIQNKESREYKQKYVLISKLYKELEEAEEARELIDKQLETMDFTDFGVGNKLNNIISIIMNAIVNLAQTAKRIKRTNTDIDKQWQEITSSSSWMSQENISSLAVLRRSGVNNAERDGGRIDVNEGDRNDEINLMISEYEDKVEEDKEREATADMIAELRESRRRRQATTY